MIEAINEQLLRAIGVGVALVDTKSGALRFANDTFIDWFGRPTDPSYPVELGSLDMRAALDRISTGDQHSEEVTFKVGRRTMTVAIEFNKALDEKDLAVLVCQNISRIKELESMIDSYAMMVERNTLEIRREKEQVEKLLLNMMPRTAYEEYKSFGAVEPRLFEGVSIMSVDFEGFSEMLAANTPAVVVSELNDIFTAFDRIGEQFGSERIRTMGDTYFAVTGVPDPVRDHAGSMAGAATRFLKYIERRNESHQLTWNVRIGLASGPVIGSVVGVQKYVYDVFGPAVSKASTMRLEAAAMSIKADASISVLLDDSIKLDSTDEA